MFDCPRPLTSQSCSMSGLPRCGLETAPPPTLVHLPAIATGANRNELEFRPADVTPDQVYQNALPGILRGKPLGALLPPLAPDGEPWAPCICQLCTCGRHHCPDVSAIPPCTTEYLEKFIELERDIPERVIPHKNKWWPEGVSEETRLQTLYRNNYIDWKQKPHFANRKEIYEPPRAAFKTDSEYQGVYTFPTPIDVLAKPYEPRTVKDFVKIHGPLKSVYGWDYDDAPPSWKKAGEPKSARYLQQKIWDKPLKLGYVTSRPFDDESTYMHDYLWFQKFGCKQPYPCPDPFFTTAAIPRPFLPWLPLSKADYIHWKDVKPAESWKPDIPYSPPPFPLVKKTTHNQSYKDWTKCGPDGIGRQKIPVVCMECQHEIRIPPEWMTEYQLNFKEYNPLWFCEDIECLVNRTSDPCRDVDKINCEKYCDAQAAQREYLQSRPPATAFDPNNPFRPKSPEGHLGEGDALTGLAYEPFDPIKVRKIPCAADVVLSGIKNAKGVGRTPCPETGHLYVCPRDVWRLLADEVEVNKRYPFRTWSKGDLDIEVKQEEKYKNMKATGGTRRGH